MEGKNEVIPCIFIILVMFGNFATCDIEKDREKCANQLVGLATCLPYVSGEAKAPPMDCCTGFNQVLQKSTDCVCILIKDRNDPSLGLKINATLALSLPARCKSPTDKTINDCPAILHLPPNSPDAKVFEDFANSGKKGNATSPAVGNSSSGTRTPTASANQMSDGGKRKRCLETGIVSGMLLAMIALQIFPNVFGS